MASDTKDMSRSVLEAEVNTLRSSIEFIMERVSDVVTENKGLKEELEAVHKTIKIYRSEADAEIEENMNLEARLLVANDLRSSFRAFLDIPITK